MIQIAQENVNDEPTTFQVMDASKLDFPNESFDAIFDFGIIHHIPNWKNCIEELRRVLKDEGFANLLFYIRGYLSDEKLADLAVGVEPTSVYHKPLAEYPIGEGYNVGYVTNAAIKKNRAILDGR